MSSRHVVRIALIAAVAALALVPTGLAAPGGGKAAGGGGGKPGGGAGTSTLSLVLADDTNGDGAANYAEKVTFNVSTTATANPQVSLKCYQSGVLVLNGSAGFGADDPWAWAQVFTLATGAWTGGAADCTATLYYYNGRRFSTLATLGFHANA